MDTEAAEGLRERKHRETRRRIADAGLRLFLDRGYDGTTVDAIAAEAGISRRTFFSYFKSKDEILATWHDDGWSGMLADLLMTSPDVRPLDAVRDVMVKHSSRYTTEQMTSIDRLLRSSASLVARKQTSYAEQEQALFATLCEVWRQPERRTALRMVAVVSIGAMRLALQEWNTQVDQQEPLATFLRRAFDSLVSELARTTPAPAHEG
ncbi:MAG: TetR/AcrR family transcriptional regulator [Vicinamibacterales bacterium]